jgi:hypothetical protein
MIIKQNQVKIQENLSNNDQIKRVCVCVLLQRLGHIKIPAEDSFHLQLES